jgi:hypothetical protein
MNVFWGDNKVAGRSRSPPLRLYRRSILPARSEKLACCPTAVIPVGPQAPRCARPGAWRDCLKASRRRRLRPVDYGDITRLSVDAACPVHVQTHSSAAPPICAGTFAQNTWAPSAGTAGHLRRNPHLVGLFNSPLSAVRAALASRRHRAVTRFEIVDGLRGARGKRWGLAAAPT